MDPSIGTGFLARTGFLAVAAGNGVSSRTIVAYEETPPVLRVSGDEDRNTQGKRRCALSRALAAQEDLRVDLAELRFADPTLMVDLAMVARRLRAAGRRLILAGPQPHILTLIQMVGLHRMDGIQVVPAPTAA
jgi:anti-anti-sigma factor